MATGLEGLLVSESQQVKELLGNVLAPFVQLGREGEVVMLLPAGRRLPVRLRILLVLLGRKGFRVMGRLSAEEEGLEPVALANAVHSPGGTVRPIIRQLFADGLVRKARRLYFVPDEALATVQDEFPPILGKEKHNG